MKTFKKIILWLLAIVAVLYVSVCIWFYTAQDKAIFKTVKRPPNYQYQFDHQFEERQISMKDNVKLSGLLFKADSARGLILWLPGGRGMLDTVGLDAEYYTELGYDIFMINYRGFGKSEGSISSEKQFNEDMQTVYNDLKKKYRESEIVIFGYSLGSGPAAELAANNRPKMLILQAPYYSLTEMATRQIPYLPVSLLSKYKFETCKSVQRVKSPIALIHGSADKKIDANASVRLKKLIEPTDQLIILQGQGHNNFVNNAEYLLALKHLLIK